MPNCSLCLSAISHLKVLVTTTWISEKNDDSIADYLEHSAIEWKCPNCNEVLFYSLEQEDQARNFLRG